MGTAQQSDKFNWGLNKAYLVEEMIKKLDVQEHGRGVCELLGHDVEERLGAERVILCSRAASLRLEYRSAHL